MYYEKFIGKNKYFCFLLNCIKNVWLVGVVTQNFRQHTHLAIPFHTSAPPPPPPPPPNQNLVPIPMHYCIFKSTN